VSIDNDNDNDSLEGTHVSIDNDNDSLEGTHVSIDNDGVMFLIVLFTPSGGNTQTKVHN
jgi:hypothetical protein